MKKGTQYTREHTREISFPLGGIGTGSIGLGGNGRLLDWEIANHPAKGSTNGHSFFAVRAERDGRLLDARAMVGDLEKDRVGQYSHSIFSGYGYGPRADTLAGFPHFADCVFDGPFPTASVTFTDPSFPGRVTLDAFNPFIPLDEDASSLPAAFFTVSVENDTDLPIDYTLALSVRNFFPEDSMNRPVDGGVVLEQRKYAPDDSAYGELAMLTDGADAAAQCFWFRGKWFDGPTVFWQEFCAGAISDRHYDAPGSHDTATLAVRLTAAPGEKRSARFVLAWYFPNNRNYWDPLPDDAGKDVTWRNYYAVLYPSAEAVARYALENFSDLLFRTEAFRNALWCATLPPAVIEAAADNLAVLKSATVLRLEDGSFYGWEGMHEDSGSCEGSCTHVWNYTYALPFLFPRLERSMRRLDYRHNMMENGGMRFRLTLPVGREGGWNMPCVDGQMGGVIKTYREWKISGDNAFLQELWPSVKRSLEFAWSPENPCRWDADMDGILEGRQHHTLDMELFGPSSWLEGFYLAALKAGAEMADAMGEADSAVLYRSLYEKGRAFCDTELFNGAWYDQKTDLTDRSILESYGSISTLNSGSILADYWNGEAGQIKYQIDHGCAIDQVLAQWHADLIGLGDIYDRAQLDTALHSLYAHNFIPTMRDYFNPCRVFSLDGEAGTVICTYPAGTDAPVIPIPYCQETMTGFEYAAAGLMIGRGMQAEGLSMVEAIRDRYDGAKRNPYNEIECGSNYARSMAAYALTATYAGFSFDMTRGHIGFAPIVSGENGLFRAPFSLEGAWGTVEIAEDRALLALAEGELTLSSLSLPFVPRRICVDGRETAFTAEEGVIRFAEPVSFTASLAAEV